MELIESLQGFQSTSPQGERPRSFTLYLTIWYISIHVPARGTTILDRVHMPHTQISIHVPARGTTKASGFVNALDKFQSTSPQGERLAWERDYDTYIRISIHVPARGTTTEGESSRSGGGISIHVPARGTTHGKRCKLGQRNISIHVPARGTTVLCTTPSV